MSVLTDSEKKSLANVESYVQSLPQPGLGFLEGMSAAYDAAELSKSNYFGSLVGDPIRKSLSRYKELTGEEVPAFYSRMGTEEAIYNLTWLDQRKATIEKFQKDPNGPPDPFLKTADQIRSEAAQTKQEALTKASRAGLGGSLVGGIASGVTDPLNILLLPTGMFAAEGILGTAVVEGLAGAAATAGVELAAQPGDVQLGMAKSSEEIQRNALIGGVFSGILGGGIKAGLKYLPKQAVRFGDKGVIRPVSEYNARQIPFGEANRIQFEGARITTDERNAILTLMDASETLPDLLTHDSQVAHANAVQAAIDMLQEEDVRIRDSYRGRLNDALRRLDESVSSGLVEANSSMMESGVAITELDNTKGTTFARSVAKPALQEQLGVEIRYSRNPDNSITLESRDPQKPFSETFPANRTWREAREQLDRLTQKLGIEPAPMTRKEQAIMKSLHLWDEYIKRSDMLDKARLEMTRRVDDKIVDIGGKPFESKTKLRAYAESVGITDYTFEKMGKGFALKPDNPYDIPGYHVDRLSEPSKRAEYVDQRIATLAEEIKKNPTPDTTPQVTTKEPDIGSAANSKLEKEVRALRAFSEENANLEVMWVDSEGRISKMPISKVLEEIDNEGIEIDGTIVCMTE
mgnify:CR=1 FL=1